MTADELLAEIGARMSLSGAVFDDNRACRLSFDGRLHVDLEAPTTARTLNAFGVVGPVPPGQSAAFYEHLLESNLPADGEPGPAIALDPLSRELVLCKSFLVEQTSVDELLTGLEQLLGEMETWSEWLSTSGHESTASGIDSDETGASPPFLSV